MTSREDRERATASSSPALPHLQRHEFVIGGYTRGTETFDARVFGYYDGDRLIDAART